VCIGLFTISASVIVFGEIVVNKNGGTNGALWLNREKVSLFEIQ
jgi:hypothetical protein